jgi:hypothetical protein
MSKNELSKRQIRAKIYYLKKTGQTNKYKRYLKQYRDYHSEDEDEDDYTESTIKPIAKEDIKPIVKEDIKPIIKQDNKKRKKVIPQVIRKIVWNKYIGLKNSIGKCLCCNAEEISIYNYECGHVISEFNGGDIIVQNLRPICSHCNRSVGSCNMDEFMDKYGIEKCKNWNGIND